MVNFGVRFVVRGQGLNYEGGFRRVLVVDTSLAVTGVEPGSSGFHSSASTRWNAGDDFENRISNVAVR